MDPEYKQIDGDGYVRFGQTPPRELPSFIEPEALEPQVRLVAYIRGVIEKVDSQSSRRLRSHAKFMLLSNFVNMIAAPLQQRRGEAK
jgi:hypothetical protein